MAMHFPKVQPLPPGWRWVAVTLTNEPLVVGEPLPVFWTAANDELGITSTDPWSHSDAQRWTPDGGA